MTKKQEKEKKKKDGIRVIPYPLLILILSKVLFGVLLRLFLFSSVHLNETKKKTLTHILVARSSLIDKER
jgi:quinol-cytochrome oxidoreductase complex cytochrome b subunit